MIKLLTQYKLSDAISKFNLTNNCHLMIGFEFEFYILSNNQKLSENKLNEFIQILNHSFNCTNFKKEQGVSQIELTIDASFDIINICYKLLFYKYRINQIAKSLNYQFIILGQPFYDDCGSALQINFSLHDNNKIFIDSNKLIENFCAELLNITPNITKLLYKNNSYNRFDYNINYNLFKKGKYTSPINLSFGYNNRTCLIRIAKSQINSNYKRIEYRAPSSDCNIINLLKTLLYNIRVNNINYNHKPIYGNSFDHQYSYLKKIEL